MVSQKGNAYLDGIDDACALIRAYWAGPTVENRKVIHDNVLNLEGIRWQYLHGASNSDAVASESYLSDDFLMQHPGNKETQLDLFLCPAFEQFFRDTELPTQLIWGKHDPFFIPSDAEASATDNAVIEFLDTVHFALENHVDFIAEHHGSRQSYCPVTTCP